MSERGRHRDAVVIITGGASGIGRASAMRLFEEGASLLIADVQGNQAMSVAQEIGDSTRVVGLAVDVRSREACEAMVQSTIVTFGKVTGLVNAAGVNQPPQMIVDLPDEEWRRVIDINLTGTFHAIQSVAPHMSQGSAIVTLASGAARVARMGVAAYSVS